MTQVLKREDSHAATVRALGFQSPPKAPTAQERRIDELQDELADLRRALAEAEAKRRADVDCAREEERQAVTAEFRRDEDAARALLGSGLRDAIDKLNKHFAEADKFGLTLALVALERVIAEPTLYQKLITEAIGVQVSNLRHDTVIAVSVSDIDFPDQTALDGLAETLGADTKVMASDSLRAGECRVDLRLGAIDISLPDYWQRLQEQCRRVLEADQ